MKRLTLLFAAGFLIATGAYAERGPLVTHSHAPAQKTHAPQPRIRSLVAHR